MAFPGATVNSTWYSGIDASVLKGRSKAEMRERMELLKEELSLLLPGSTAFSGIDIMLVRFGRRSFLPAFRCSFCSLCWGSRYSTSCS